MLRTFILRLDFYFLSFLELNIVFVFSFFNFLFYLKNDSVSGENVKTRINIFSGNSIRVIKHVQRSVQFEKH